MSAFRAALESGYGVELDVHLLKDGNLAVIHDASLKRTTGADGKIEDLTTEQLSQYHLEGTSETIPTLRQVLELVDGKIPLIIELKAVGNNYGTLCRTVCEALAEYAGPYCMESFDPRCVYWLKRHAPQIIRGQLAENFLEAKGSPVPWVLRLFLTCQLFNCMTRPDFVAYKFTDRKRLGNRLVRRVWGVQGVTWTLKNQTDHDTAMEEGWIPIFEDYTP
jgi:glycerophosphoryl diester phosphodiesterase